MSKMYGFAVGTLTFVIQVIAIHSLSVEMSLYPSDKYIFIGEKTIVNTTIRFPEKVSENVHVTLYPTMDGPDVYLRRILGVHVGENLMISGDLIPVMDWGRKDSVQGNYFACEFHLGTVKRAPKSWRAKDDVITFQYETVMGNEGTYEDGDDHILGASVKSADDFAILTKHATMMSRTLPLLFRSLNKEAHLKSGIAEMLMEKANGTKLMYQ